MADSHKRKPDPQDLRVEYQVANDFYIQSVSTRFTIAGFYLAATGLLAQSGLDASASVAQRCIMSLLGLILGASVWVLELRTRALCGSMARRMVEIERKYWFPDPEDWYEGTMSHDNKTLPSDDHPHRSRIPDRPEPERPKIAWMKNPLPAGFSWYITHSMGFDLLYPATVLFWIAVFGWSVSRVI